MANRGTQRKLTHRQSSAERPIGPLARPVTASSKPSLKGKNLSHLSASGVSLSSRRWVSSRGSSRSQQTHSVRSPPQIQPLPRHHFASPYLRDLNASLLSKHQQAGSDVGQARQGEEKQTEGTKHGSVSLGTLRGGSKAPRYSCKVMLASFCKTSSNCFRAAASSGGGTLSIEKPLG